MIITGHQPQSVPRKVKITCCVCNLEQQFLKASASENTDKRMWSVCNIVACTNNSCHQHFHCVQVHSSNYIFQMPQFEGMTCFEIAHHKSTVGLWVSNPKFKYMQRGSHDTWKKDKKRAYLVMTSLPIYIQLWQKYWSVKKRKRVDKDNDNNNDSEDK